MKKILFACLLFGAVFGQPFGEWVQTDPVSDVDDVNNVPKVGVDGSCNAVAVWVNAEESGDDQIIQGAKLQAGAQAWTPTTTISQTNVNLQDPLIEVAPNGDAVILYKNSSQELFGARLPTGSTTWLSTTPSPIASNIEGYDLAMNAFGDVIAAWDEFDAVEGTTIIRAARLTAGSTNWEFTNPVTELSETTNNNNPVVDINDCGDAVVIWSALESEQNEIFLGARLAVGSNAWELTDTIFTGFTNQYDVALDDSGRAIAVYRNNGIRGAKLPKNTLDWIDTSNLSNNSADFFPKVKVDGPKCIAVAIWEQQLFAARGLAQGVQGAVLPFDELNWVVTNDLAPDGQFAALAMDEFGNAIAVWERGGMFIEGATLDAGSTTWVETNDLRMAPVNTEVGAPDVAVSPNGELAVGVWEIQIFGSGEQIEAATNCSPFTPQPPPFIRGTQEKNVFSSQSECFNRIFWAPSPSGNLDFYRVLRNGNPIAQVDPRAGLIYEDHNQKKGVKTTYEVHTVGLNGKESAGITVTVP